MKYMGSKNRIAKFILPIMLEEAKAKGITQWVEPFVGGGNMIDKVPTEFTRVGYDINEHTIAALIGIRDYLEQLPSNVSEQYYRELKKTPPDPVTSWVRFECSFGAKFENGFARNNQGTNYALCGKNLAVKQSPKIQTVKLACLHYKEIPAITNSLIYCDPPYKGTTSYKTAPFNHEEFFTWCIEQKSKGNIVFVSEYEAPFEEVWRGEIKTNFASTRTSATHNAVEKLFKV